MAELHDATPIFSLRAAQNVPEILYSLTIQWQTISSVSTDTCSKVWRGGGGEQIVFLCEDNHKEEEEEGSDKNATKDKESSAETKTTRVADQKNTSASRVKEGPTNPSRPLTPKQQKLLPNSARNQSKAENTDGGSKLILSTSTSTLTGADGSHACLPNAVMSVLFDELNSELLRRDLLSNKPTKRDMSISDIKGTLRNQDLDLKLVTPNYCKKGGSLEFFLMKEDACRLVLAIKLRNSNDDSWGHFIAWDRNIIHHDNPHSYKVELKSDRTRKGSKATFRKLFPKKKFPHADVSAVWKLVHYS